MKNFWTKIIKKKNKIQEGDSPEEHSPQSHNNHRALLSDTEG